MKKGSAMSPLSVSVPTWGDEEAVTFADYIAAAEEAVQEGRLDAAARFLDLAYFLGDRLNAAGHSPCRHRIH